MSTEQPKNPPDWNTLSTEDWDDLICEALHTPTHTGDTYYLNCPCRHCAAHRCIAREEAKAKKDQPK